MNIVADNTAGHEHGTALEARAAGDDRAGMHDSGEFYLRDFRSKVLRKLIARPVVADGDEKGPAIEVCGEACRLLGRAADFVAVFFRTRRFEGIEQADYLIFALHFDAVEDGAGVSGAADDKQRLHSGARGSGALK